MPTVQSKCFSCRRDPVPCDEHPNCAPGGPLAGLGMQLACRLCLVRLVGSWPLTEEGKHRWCVVCACETDDTAGMKRQAGMTMQEYTALLKSGMVDNGEGAALFTCEKPKCPGAWCALCILRHCGHEAMLAADADARWECPPCAGLVPVSVPVAALGAALAFAFPASCLLRLSRSGALLLVLQVRLRLRSWLLLLSWLLQMLLLKVRLWLSFPGSWLLMRLPHSGSLLVLLQMRLRLRSRLLLLLSWLLLMLLKVRLWASLSLLCFCCSHTPGFSACAADAAPVLAAADAPVVAAADAATEGAALGFAFRASGCCCTPGL